MRIVVEAAGGEIGEVSPKAEACDATFTIEVASSWRRRAATAEGVRTYVELTIEDAARRGWKVIRRPADQISTSEDLPRGEAEQLLRQGVGLLQAARNHFGITFGLGLAAFHIP